MTSKVNSKWKRFFIVCFWCSLPVWVIPVIVLGILLRGIFLAVDVVNYIRTGEIGDFLK